MIDHVSLKVSDLQVSRDFYDNALASLGMKRLFDADGYCGYGIDRPIFWISQEESTSKAHVAFAAKSEFEVHAFYEAAIAAGGVDNGKPGPRPEYHEKYYGAFVLDPDGNNIEAVFGNA